jgi:hypothetical protein
MATIQVILAGARMANFDTYDYPIVLQFGDQKSYNQAVWFIPSSPSRIPARRLSEIRVQGGPLSVLIDGPDGFKSGPYQVDWVRNSYPRGKDCALIQMHSESKSMGGVTLTVLEEMLFVEQLSVGGNATAPSST